MWQIKWLRRLVRRNTRKIPEEKAAVWKRRLSISYAILAWHAFGIVVYMCYTGKAATYAKKDELTGARWWAEFLDIKEAHVIRVKGLKVEGSYDINRNDEKEVQEESVQI